MLAFSSLMLVWLPYLCYTVSSMRIETTEVMACSVHVTVTGHPPDRGTKIPLPSRHARSHFHMFYHPIPWVSISSDPSFHLNIWSSNLKQVGLSSRVTEALARDTMLAMTSLPTTPYTAASSWVPTSGPQRACFPPLSSKPRVNNTTKLSPT